ncbi:MAG: cysteine--tRNA ligase [Actinomycetia bacterium]|nr:cysteine--tRNA ligase [Actinomycetes bacterium]
MISVYDTRAGAERPFEPVTPGVVGIYVCGITPYAEPHLGHARPAVVWDVIRRHLERRGYLVTLVQNFTDVDDRIIERAGREGVSAAAVAARYAEAYWQAVLRLGVRPPDYMPRATGNIPAIVDLIRRLVDKGYAYQAGSDVYFRVRKFPAYGALSHRDPDEMRTGARVEPNPLKEDPLDFALWKGARPGEPAWDSPFGPGRPGWHIECSAMAWRFLGPVVDLHGGGVDLIFPHHENEIAQSEAALDTQPHVRYWVHNGLVTTDGVKMSKSLDNGMDLARLLDEFGPAVVRGYLLSVHYRTPLDFSLAALDDFRRAFARVARLWEAVADAPPGAEPPGGPEGRILEEFPGRLLSALDRDFNTAAAWAAVFDMIRAANALLRAGGPTAAAAAGLARRNLVEADRALGLLLAGAVEVARPTTPAVPPEVMALVAERDRARAARDWPRADALREEIGRRGWRVEDTPSGPVVRRADA